MEHWKKHFILLSAGQVISMLTSSILQISIVWYLTQRTGSPVIVTLSTLAGYLPRALFGLFTGVFIDRFNRKKVLMFSDLGIALCALVLGLVAYYMEPPLALIMVVLCMRSVGAAFHQPSLQAILPSIVPKEYLAKCAGFSQSFDSISLILSPAIAGILFSIWDLSFIIFLDVIGAIIAVVIVLCLPIPKTIQSDDSARPLRIIEDTKEGLNILRQEKGMLAIMVISTLYAFIYFPIGSMYPLITMTYFGGSVSDSSLVEILFSGGTLIGGLLLGLWGSKACKIRAIITSIFLYGTGVTIIGLLPPQGLLPFMIISAFMGMTLPFYYGVRTAIIQTKIPGEYHGRVFSLIYSISLFASPLGLLLGGSFSEVFGVNLCFFLCGVLAISLAICMRLWPSIRRIKD